MLNPVREGEEDYIEASGMLRHVLKPNLHKIWKQS